ncbi:MAG: fibronectin type III domain-containing protein, partial [Elusimicrobiota bacterium]|nr:fibronectin type III domain-containing protein [Elusimicrobiota bacterium]
AVDAEPVHSVGSRIDSSGIFSLSGGNEMAEQAALYPIESNEAFVETIKMNFVPSDPTEKLTGAYQGEKDVPVLSFDIRVSTLTSAGAGGGPTLDSLRIKKENFSRSVSDADIDSIKVYYDPDGSGELKEENLVSSGNDNFTGGEALVNLTTGNVITAGYKTYVVAVDIADGAEVGKELTVILDTEQQDIIQINPPQRIILEKGGLPSSPFYRSSDLVIRHEYTPTTPEITVKQWINSATTVKGSWKSSTLSNYGIRHNQYRAGNFADPESGWSDLGPSSDKSGEATAETTIQGLTLEHGEIYSFDVRTRTRDEAGNVYASDIGKAQFRVDLNPPTNPSQPIPQQITQDTELTDYNVNWGAASDNATGVESGVALYEVQERKDTSPVWKTIATPAGDRLNIFIQDKEPGSFYYYRVRARDEAGNWSAWSEVSEAAATGLPEKAIDQVSNYPNPARFDLGDEYTRITYRLKYDSRVDVYLYDMMGHLVKEWNFESGEEGGGKKGPNSFDWYGKNARGSDVAKGGYLLRIVARTPEGVVEETRRIAIIK